MLANERHVRFAFFENFQYLQVEVQNSHFSCCQIKIKTMAIASTEIEAINCCV